MRPTVLFASEIFIFKNFFGNVLVLGQLVTFL